MVNPARWEIQLLDMALFRGNGASVRFTARGPAEKLSVQGQTWNGH